MKKNHINTVQKIDASTILGGACSLDPKFQYQFKFHNDFIFCKRWPLGEPDKMHEIQSEAEVIRAICFRILNELPDTAPPFEPSSIQVQIEIDGGQKFFFHTHPPHELFFELLTHLKKLY